MKSINKIELIDFFKKKGVITKTNKRKCCWKKYFDKECLEIFLDFSKNYRSENEAWFCLLNNIEPVKCEVCGELSVFTGDRKHKYLGYRSTCKNCSPNASKVKLKKFNETIKTEKHKDKIKKLDRSKDPEKYCLYGSEKFKNLMRERYGNPYYNNIEKIKNTNIKKYGVSCNLALNNKERSKKIWKERHEEILDKIKSTNLKNRNTKFPGQSKEVIQKICERKIKTVEEIEQKFECTQQAKLIKKYGEGWLKLKLEKIIIKNRKFIANSDIPKIIEYFNSPREKSISNKEKELLKEIKKIYKGKILENKKNIIFNKNKCYELDIFLPELSIAFEFNGAYWHSNLNKNKYYHQNKTKLCYEKGIQLIHIYEYEWDKSKDEILNDIKKALNGEQCEKRGWIKSSDYKKYELSEPRPRKEYGYTVYDEGEFIKIK